MQSETKKPLISIIMNCYNGEKYISESIKSIIDQTYKNWELILWDNCSTDNSEKIFKKLNDKRLKYYKAQNHTTLYHARNLAIQKTTGEYIAFIDTDDLWDKNKLHEQVKIFLKNSKISVCYTNLWLLKEDKKKIFIKKGKSKIINNLLSNYNLGIITTLIKKKDIDDNNYIFNKKYSVIGDFDFFSKLSKNKIFYYLNTPLAYYRLHPDSFSSKNKKMEVEELKNWLEENKIKLSNDDVFNVEKRIFLKEILYYKLYKNFKDYFNCLTKLKINYINLKLILLLLIPVVILKKISWFHN